MPSTTNTKKSPAWVRLLGFAAGGALATIGTVVVRVTVGMSDDRYREMLTIGFMFVAVGLVVATVAYLARSSSNAARHDRSSP